MNLKTVFSKSILTAAIIAMSSASFAMPYNSNRPTVDLSKRDGKYTNTSTLKLCVDYYKLTANTDKQEYLKELNLRGQLSAKDESSVAAHKLIPGMTMCGMYMSIGTPMSAETRQLRPMVYKTVHVYPEHYAVTQSGVVVEVYPRNKGSLPPALAKDAPAVAPSPTLK
jgi:hypothetical protein